MIDINNIILTSSVNYVAHDFHRFLRKSPKDLELVFIDTAAEVEKGDLEWLKADRDSLVKAGFKVSDFTITGKSRKDIQNMLSKMDVIFFSGGNQFYLLQKIQESHCYDLILDFVKYGKIYIGCSAGSIIAGPDIYPTRLIDEVGKVGVLKLYTGLGLVDFIVLPHWGSDDFKGVYFPKRLKNVYESNYKFILLRDNQYIRIKDGWLQIISVDFMKER
jgi:dipeptidase E